MNFVLIKRNISFGKDIKKKNKLCVEKKLIKLGKLKKNINYLPEKYL